MRHRWIRAAGLGFSLFTAAVLTVSPAPFATAQMIRDGQPGSPRIFWDEQAHRLDRTTPHEESLEKATPFCEWTCGNQRDTRYSACNGQASVCLISAHDARLACIESCGGDPTCVDNCDANYLLWEATCRANYNSCTGVADELYRQCIDSCSDGGFGGGGCDAVTQTATAALSLEVATAVGRELTSVPVNFSLARVEYRGQESFIREEWAIVKDGRVRVSSDPAFAQAMTDQEAAPPRGSFLVIQEPVHVMNSRHVPKPVVRILSTGLAPSERGEGEIVAARLELSPASSGDRVEIVYTSVPMDETRLKQFVSRRIGLVFASNKEHRTAVYVVFRLTDRFELLGTFTALPQCCCGGVFCI